MDKTLRNLVDKLWDVIEQAAIAMELRSEVTTVNKAAKQTYEEEFARLYEYIAVYYMKDSKEALDRHKVAAISIISAIKAKVFESGIVEEGYAFFGNYIIAVDAALTYMLEEMNKRLEAKGEKRIESYYFPQAMACRTDYYRIFYRNLYFADTNATWGLNPLDIAERLFLIEYMTLEKNGVDPSLLNEYDQGDEPF